MESGGFGHNLSSGVRKGAWSADEDLLLTRYIHKYGEGNWHLIPKRAELNRCRKSCRLRWLNYLSPRIKRGNFVDDEIDLIVRLHKLLGNRWSLIAGRIPGRTANDVKNFWNLHLKRIQKPTCSNKKTDILPKFDTFDKVEVIKPRARTFSNTLFSLKNKSVMIETQTNVIDDTSGKTKHGTYQNLSTRTLLEHETNNESSLWSLKSPNIEVGPNLSSKDMMSLEQRNDYWQQYLSTSSSGCISEMELKVDNIAFQQETLSPPNTDWDNLTWENMDIWDLLIDHE